MYAIYNEATKNYFTVNGTWGGAAATFTTKAAAKAVETGPVSDAIYVVELGAVNAQQEIDEQR